MWAFLFLFYLAAVLHALGAMHHDVDFGVGSSASDVACHNLNFVHNACWVVTHQVNNLFANESQWFAALDRRRCNT